MFIANPIYDIVFKYRTLTRLIENPEVQQSMAEDDVMFDTLAREVEEKTLELQEENRGLQGAMQEEQRLREAAEAEIARLKRLLQQNDEQ